MLTRQELAEQAASLAVQGVYVGTPSRKYGFVPSPTVALRTSRILPQLR